MPDPEGLPFHTFLYENPHLYDQIFPDRTSSPFVMKAIKRYASSPPSSVVDFGCGTGSTLEILSRFIPVCVGVDLIPAMVEYGRAIRPVLDLQVGDMRKTRLGRTFDIIECFGWAFSYALTDRDIEAVVTTFRQHAHPESVLVFDCGCADWYLKQESGIPDTVLDVGIPGFAAQAISRFELDRTNLILTRRRTWDMEGGSKAEDFTQYRLHRTENLREVLETKGFKVLEIGLDPTGQQQAPGEHTLYVIAIVPTNTAP